MNGFSEAESDHPDPEIYLDALALLEAHHRHDAEGFSVVLAAAGGCPWYLSQLVCALADLGALALEGHPESVIDGFLAENRRIVLEQS